MSERRETYTPPQTRERRERADYGLGLGTGTPAPLRRVVARMNEAAIFAVHRSTAIFLWLGLFVFAVGIGFQLLAMGDFLWHHVLGVWPRSPEVYELKLLKEEHMATEAELTQLREGLTECLGREELAAPVEEAR